MSRATYDTVVIGGGVMGATVAFRLASAGHAVAILDRGGLCM
jgi:glycine/D-amino acid oxidase-like deaminating enzyme